MTATIIALHDQDEQLKAAHALLAEQARAIALAHEDLKTAQYLINSALEILEGKRS